MSRPGATAPGAEATSAIGRAPASMSPHRADRPRGPGRPRDEAASQAIFDAALRQVQEVGYGRMTVESVAAEAGVSRASVYRRFRDKSDLVTAAIAQGYERPDALKASDPRDALIVFLEEFDARFAESCLEVIGSLVGAREDPGALEMHRARVVTPRLGYARSLLEAARDRGELDANADLDVALQMLAGSVLCRRMSGVRATRDWARRAVATVWAGMAPVTGPPA